MHKRHPKWLIQTSSAVQHFMMTSSLKQSVLHGWDFVDFHPSFPCSRLICDDFHPFFGPIFIQFPYTNIRLTFQQSPTPSPREFSPKRNNQHAGNNPNEPNIQLKFEPPEMTYSHIYLEQKSFR